MIAAVLSGHLWTVAPRMRHILRPYELPASEPWQAVVEDPAIGPVRLSGRLLRPPQPLERPASGNAAFERRASGSAAPERRDELLVLLHGLGGSIDSHYMPRGVLAAEAAGMSSLRLNLRGADLSGDDFPHAGLTADLHAALASPALGSFRRIYLLGYSLGGHLALHYATEPGDPRVVRVAALCAPLDLAQSQAAIDAPANWLYRRYLLGNLVRLYAAIAARRRVPVPVAEVARMRRIRELDERVVAPRYGFAGADDYYARASVAPRLGQLRVPALLVDAERDPMVRARAVRPALASPAPRLTVRWTARGGHLGFPRHLDLGLDGAATRARSIDDQILAWLRSTPSGEGP